jgi:hypothetical protein
VRAALFVLLLPSRTPLFVWRFLSSCSCLSLPRVLRGRISLPALSGCTGICRTDELVCPPPRAAQRACHVGGGGWSTYRCLAVGLALVVPLLFMAKSARLMPPDLFRRADAAAGHTSSWCTRYLFLEIPFMPFSSRTSSLHRTRFGCTLRALRGR